MDVMIAGMEKGGVALGRARLVSRRVQQPSSGCLSKLLISFLPTEGMARKIKLILHVAPHSWQQAERNDLPLYQIWLSP